MEEVYTLKRRKDTKELHLFEGRMTANDRCNIEASSICKKMNKNDGDDNVFACQTADTARTECAQIGRAVCGICVSHLYDTY